MALDQLRDVVARLERHRVMPDAPPPLPFGLPALDAALAGGGLARGALHEIAGTGADIQHGAAAALFAAGILARIGKVGDPAWIDGKVLWVLEQHDLFAPGLAAAGLHPDRVIYAHAGRKDALLVMEDGLRHRGLAGVAAEISGKISLTASRRLQLAAEATGVTALLLRRPAKGEAELAGANAAITRWRVAAQPSAPPIPEAPDVPGLGRAQWRLDLLRSRGGKTGSWIVEACDASGRLDMVAALADRPPAQGARDRRAAA